MRYGCFVGIDQIADACAGGYSDVELSVETVGILAQTQRAKHWRFLDASCMRAGICGALMPLNQNLSISSKAFDCDGWLNTFDVYAPKTLEAGAYAWVFGCGKPRSLYGLGQESKDRVDAFIADTAKVLHKHGIQLYIEPLGPNYSDYLNTVPEAAALVERLGLPNLSIMCDMRHMIASADSFENLMRYKEFISHAHIDYPYGMHRFFPQPGDGYDYSPYIEALKGIGYGRILSVEATDYNDFANECKSSLRYIRQLWER